MMLTVRILSVIITVLACGVTAMAQTTDSLTMQRPDTTGVTNPQQTPGRRVTPVENVDGKPWKPGLYRYDKHGNPLKVPVAVLVDEDTVKTDYRPKEKLYGGVLVGVNIFDGILQIAGQSYASYNIEASVDLHNWFFPTVEAGIGIADNTPDRLNYTYKCGPAFFAKIGLDYNFLYRSDAAYALIAGVRLGFSSFSYDLTGVTLQSPYWQETQTIDLCGQHSTALYGEVLAGIRVRLYKGLHMGWTMRYKALFQASEGANGAPWYIPGFGARNAPLSATFTIAWKF